MSVVNPMLFYLGNSEFCSVLYCTIYKVSIHNNGGRKYASSQPYTVGEDRLRVCTESSKH